MAEAILLEGVKSVASTIIDSLLKEGFSYLSYNLSSKLRDLQTNILPQFQLLIKAAERSNKHKGELELWLRKLKDALYEAEDVVDLYRYQLLKEKVFDLNTHPALKRFKKVARKANSKVFILSPQKIELRRSLNKLEMIAAEAKTFRELLGMQIEDAAPNLGTGGQPNVTTSLPQLEVFGRDKERDEIIDKYLLDESEASKARCYSVVSIVGIGGAGKTTLAQYIYNNQRVVDHFDIKMWVCVSRKLDIFKHLRQMIESSSRDECPNIMNLDVLQEKLIDMIKSKKVLLVLDDVWCDKSVNEVEWEKLLAPLAHNGKKGSKILVTTRSEKLPVALHPQYSMQLRDLEENVIISLFMHHAFGGAKSIDMHLQNELEDIGRQIVQKLYGSPLAAKAVGGQLSKKLEPKFWRAALDRNNLRDTQQALIWSYQCLDAPLQRCFSYFSLFPKGHIFKAKDIVCMWIAEGFINSSNNSMTLEDIGMSYFDELVSVSFLQLGDLEYYSMHDLFHDLAENISKEEYLRIEDDHVKEISPTIRHLYISDGSLLEDCISVNKIENLRTLIIVDDSISSSVIDHLLVATNKFKKLRVLDLSGNITETLLKSIGDLKHLRYLDLSKAEVDVVLGKLYHLQVLMTYDYTSATLPRSLKNLISLRHFEGDYDALTTVPDIGRLTSLQTLPEFHIKKEKGYDIGQLRNLNELRGWLSIQNLENIEGKDKAVEANLKNKKHLESLVLNWKEDDESDSRRDLDREVLEGLQPHPPNLTYLSINGYKSPEFPSWLPLRDLRSLKIYNCNALEVLPPMSNLFPNCHELNLLDLPNLRKLSSLPPSLEELEIQNCIITDGALSQSLETLMSCDVPRGGNYPRGLHIYLEVWVFQLTSLKSLTLYGINTITTLPSEEVLHHLVALTHLEIWECHSLKSVGGLHVLPSLEWLRFSSCPCLELEMVMPAGEGGGRGILPPSLQRLIIWKCDFTDGALSQSLGGLTSLKFLSLLGINTITTLPSEEILHHLISLTKLYIKACHSLKSVGGLYALPSLEMLSFESCPCLEWEMVMPTGEGGGKGILPPLLQFLCLKVFKFMSCDCLELERMMPGEGGGRAILPPSLRSVVIERCRSMKNFVVAAAAGDLPNVAKLNLSHCPSLVSLSLSHLTALIALDIYYCPSIVFVSKEEVEERVEEDSFGGKQKIELILPSSLQSLKISECDITEGALSQSLERLTSLKSLKLASIKTITTLPSEEILHHLISLTHLQIDGCPQLKSVGGLYALPSLEELEFCGFECFELETVILAGEGGGKGILPPSLRSLNIERCMRMKSFVVAAGDLPNLVSLVFRDCLSLASLSLSRLTALEVLEIYDCPGILSLPDYLPESLASISISTCPGILSLPDYLPESLTSIHISDCPGILSLPDHLPESLTSIHISDCPCILSLPDHLPESLTSIKIYNCPVLKKRCRRPNGEDWPKIARIPYRYIG
ncbi:putative disease resistance protein RGA4 [Typha latifolia]|uniref:putative disease resistance protein RGA4 n=1 Tax=Typha latifolia TaxID=4733 RepID=UPI003C2DF159